MVTDELWERLEREYDVQGYTDSLIIMKLKHLIELDSKIEAIKNLLKNQPTITVTPQGYYSVTHIFPSQGQKIVEEIMRILFEKSEFSDITTQEEPDEDSR